MSHQDLYLLRNESGMFLRSGKNSTIAVYDELSKAKAQRTRLNKDKSRYLFGGKYDIYKIKDIELQEV